MRAAWLAARTRPTIVAVMLFCAVALTRAQAPPPVDVATLGPKLGETVPDFELPDQRGTPRRLSSLLGPRGAMLVFYRSADW